MAKSDEQRLVWVPLRKELNKLKWHHQRFEDKLTVGIPDVNIHVPNFGDIWVELKYVRCIHKATDKVNLGLRREQYIWLKEGQQAGRQCYLMVRVGNLGWYLWNDAGAWRLAKKLAPWSELISRCAAFKLSNSPIELLMNGFYE